MLKEDKGIGYGLPDGYDEYIKELFRRDRNE